MAPSIDVKNLTTNHNNGLGGDVTVEKKILFTIKHITYSIRNKCCLLVLITCLCCCVNVRGKLDIAFLPYSTAAQTSLNLIMLP